MGLIDAHGATLDTPAAVEGGLPGVARPAGVAAEVSNRSKITHHTWPRVQVAMRRTQWVPVRLSRRAVPPVEGVRVDLEAVERIRARHAVHIAIDVEGRPGAVLVEPKVPVWVGRRVSGIELHLADSHAVV
eukprot:CAMPEP_0170466194 /NCGR_PEP_ID=MMETSP0123-20130129/10247_1 /TAXON_ID=182087 /ORGANISM="Favella ehrenbergii, Strain Fehren 1" /LENGTH=130 /DNA_ID=CAMNT_0010732265 /DNA_START=357 /DNA_END=749 /DNA_ORIENTATION=+